MNNITFFKISGKNELKYLTQEDIKKNLDKIYSMLSELENENIGDEIKKYFSKKIKKSNNELMIIILDIINRYIKQYHLTFNNDSFYDIINDYLSTPNQNEFILNKKNSNDLIKVLSYIFIQMKKYKIKKFEILNNKIKELNLDKINVKQYYYNTNYSNNQSNKFINSATISYIPNINNNKIYNYPYSNSKEKFNFSLPIELIILLYKLKDIQKLTINIEETDQKRKLENIIISLNFKWLFPNINYIEFDLIDEELQKGLNQVFDIRISSLLNKRTGEIKLKSTNYDNKYKRNESFLPFGYISLLNKDFSPFNNKNKNFNKNNKFQLTDNQVIDYLYNDNNNDSFPNSTYDNSESYDNEKDFSDSYERISSIVPIISPENKNYFINDDNFSNISTKVILENFILKNIHPFENIIFLCDSISFFKNIHKLKLSFNDTFSNEIEMMLNKKNINITQFNFLIFFYKFDRLKELIIDFNSIDSISFEKILSIIQRNRYLEKIHISFFTPEENYSPTNLLKLYTSYKLSIRKLINEQQNELSSNLFKNFQYNEIDYFLIGRKFNKNFEDNFSHFFYIIQTRTNLKELLIFLDTPTIIITNSFYINILTKTIFNLFAWLALCKNSIKIFSIICPFLNLNSTIYPQIIDLFDETIMKENNIIEKLSIQFQFYNISNLFNLISFNLKYLFLGDLDIESFYCFIESYSNKEFILKSKLISIKLGLNMTIIHYSKIEKPLKDFLLNTPKYLEEKILLSSIEILDYKKLIELHKIMYYKDKTKNICIQISNSSSENNHNVLIELHHQIQNFLFNIGFAFNRNPLKMINKKTIRNKIKQFFQIPKNRKIFYCHDKRYNY